MNDCSCNHTAFVLVIAVVVCLFVTVVALGKGNSLPREVVYLLGCLVVTWLEPRETAAVLVHVLCTP